MAGDDAVWMGHGGNRVTLSVEDGVVRVELWVRQIVVSAPFEPSAVKEWLKQCAILLDHAEREVGR